MKKFIGSFFLLFALVFFPAISYSATNTENPEFPSTFPKLPDDAKNQSNGESSNVIVSEIHVGAITLTENSYTAGSTIKGSVNLENKGKNEQTDIYLDVSLVGDYSIAQGRFNLPDTIYDTKTFGPFKVNGGAVGKIPFSYTMPKNIGGKGLGIQIHAHSVTGFQYGWNDAYLSEVKGGQALLSVVEAYTNVEGVKNMTGAGPTIQATSTVDFHLKVKNSGSASITVIPNIEIYDRLSSGALIKEYKDKSVTISPKGSHEFVFTPYKNNNVPGVYVAKVSLESATGDSLAPSTEYRYIMPGATATIHEVKIDQRSVNKGDVVNAEITYSGPPRDILTRDKEKISNATLNVEVLDADTDKTIGEDALPIDLSLEPGKINTPVKIKSGASSIKANVTITADGKVLATYSTEASTPDPEKANSKNGETTDANFIVLVSLLAIGLLSVFYFIRKGDWRKAIVITLIFIGLIVGLLMFNQSASAVTVTKTYSYSRQCNWYLPPPPPGFPPPPPPPVGQAPWVCNWYADIPWATLTLTNPANSIIATGDPVSVAGYLSSAACSNTAEHAYIEVSLKDSAGNILPNTTYTYNQFYANCSAAYNAGQGHTCGGSANQTNFAFSIPQNLTPGNYLVFVKTYDAWGTDVSNRTWMHESWEEYQTPITIVASPTGTLDIASCTQFAGWACDPAQPNTPIQVHFYDGPGFSNFIAGTTANIATNGADKTAIGVACSDAGDHRFNVTPTLSAGNHTIYAYAIAGSNPQINGSPSAQFTCAAPAIPAPVVTGPSTGVLNTSYNFNAVSSSSGVTLSLKYGFDWDRDGTVNTWLPSSSTYVNSGTPVTGTQSWSTLGAKTFQVKAEDADGNVSPWAPFTIIIGQQTCSNGAPDYPTCTPLSEMKTGANSILSYARCPSAGSATSTVEIAWSPSSLASPTYEVFRGTTKIDTTTGYNTTDLDQSLGSTIQYYVHTLSSGGSGTSPVVSVATPSSCTVTAPPNDAAATVKTFGAVPPLGNPGYTCTLSWELESYRSNGSSSCTITGPSGLSASFKPVNKLGSAKVYNVTNESQYSIYCEGSGTPPIKKFATCRINPDYVEIP